MASDVSANEGREKACPRTARKTSCPGCLLTRANCASRCPRVFAKKPGKQPSAVCNDPDFAIAGKHIEALKYVGCRGSGTARP